MPALQMPPALEMMTLADTWDRQRSHQAMLCTADPQTVSQEMSVRRRSRCRYQLGDAPGMFGGWVGGTFCFRPGRSTDLMTSCLLATVQDCGNVPAPLVRISNVNARRSELNPARWGIRGQIRRARTHCWGCFRQRYTDIQTGEHGCKRQRRGVRAAGWRTHLEPSSSIGSCVRQSGLNRHPSRRQGNCLRRDLNDKAIVFDLASLLNCTRIWPEG